MSFEIEDMADPGRAGVAIGLCGLKKADRLRLLPGVGGTCAKLSIVRSDNDGLGPLLTAVDGDEP